MSENEDVVVTKTEESTGKPTHAYVPPRIDPDLYQADVPDWCPDSDVGDEKSHILLTDSGLHSRSVYSEKYDNSESVQEFLVTVRNLLDPVCPRTQKFWLRNQTSLPLESDVFALEYLSSYDYDVNKALFSLYCELGSGKDALLTGRSVTVADRTSSNVIFSDCKERILRAPSQTILGTYPAVLSSVNPRVPFIAGHGESSGNQGVTAALLSAGVTSPLSLTHPSPSSPLNNSNSARGVQYAVFSSVVSHPRQEELVARLALENVKPEPLDILAGKSTQKMSLLSSNKNKKDNTKNTVVTSIDDTIPTISTNNIDINTTEDNNTTTSIVRTSKPRGASSDKVELRKKWLNIAQRAYFLLNQPSLPGNYNQNHSSSNNNSNNTINKQLKQRGSLEEGQILLDIACNLPNYTPAMSGIGSSIINSSLASNMSNTAVALAAEEAFLLDNLNLLMGKLTKAVLAGRFLVSEIRDAIYSCSIDALILTHPSDMKMKSGNKKGNADSLMNGFAELQKELNGQALCAKVEEEQLADVVMKTNGLLKEVRVILRECCAWESATPITPPVPVTSAWTALSLPSNTTRGRPYSYTSEQVKALLQHHIQLCIADGQCFEPSVVGKRPTMEQVAELIRQAALNPVKISEMVYIEDMHRLGLQQVHMASTILVRATQLSIAKTRLTLDRTRYNLSEVQSLLQRMHTFPFRSDEVDALQLLLTRAVAWRNEVVQISGGALVSSTTDLNDTTTTAKTTGGSRSSSRKTDSTANNKPIPLKKVETLIAEGEHLPFEFKEELEILKEKKLQAKLWLDKLKRSFVPTKVGHTRHKKNTDETTAVTGEKLSLSDMKMMVSEGESLYQQPMEDDTEYGVGVISSAIAGVKPPAATSRTANRELDRAQAVVENAEDWISRVRDLLCGGEEEELHGSASKESMEGESVEEEEEDHEETIQALRHMLAEAESMPVTLDECGFLRCHLQAMEWAAKVRPLLNSSNYSTTEATTTTTGMEEQGEDEDSTSAEGAARRRSSRQKDLKAASRTKVPRLTEMQQYAKEITRIRASMSNAGSDFPLKPLPEEAACVALVAEAEKWLNRLKKVTQGTTVRKGIKLTRLEQLHDEGSHISINFDNELRPLKTAITAAQEWMEEHKTLLSRLGVKEEQEQVDAVELSEEGTAGADVAHATTPSAPTTAPTTVDTTADTTETDLKPESDSMEVADIEVTLSDLREAAQSASQLSADFELSWRAQELLYQIERWVAKVDHMCSVSARAASGSSEAESTSTTTIEGPRSTKRKRTFAGDSSGEPSETVEEDDGTGDTADLSGSQALVSLDEIDSLVVQGRSFGLNLEDKVQSLLSVKNHAEAWEREAMQYISTQFAENFKKIFVEYKRIVSDYTASDNGAIFPYVANRKPSALTPANQAKAYKEESILHTKLTTLLNEVIEVRAVGERIGVETPFYHTILIFIRLLEWVSEARGIACHQAAARRPVPADQQTGKPGPKGGRGRGSKTAQLRSWKGWEDLKEPIKYGNWGDVGEELVLSLIREGSTMLENLYPISTDEKLPGMLTHYSRGLLAPAAEYQDREDLLTKEGATEEEDEEQGDEEDTQEGDGNGDDQEDVDNDSDQEEETGDNTGDASGEATKKRRRVATMAAARKKRALQTSSLHTGVEKSTRGASGVSKKRVDSDYVDTVNLLHVHSTTPTEKGKKNKRQRGVTTDTTQIIDEKVAVDTARDDVAVEPTATPPVPLDLARTARRAGLDSYFKSENIQKVRLAPAMAYTLDLWLRALKVYALRLRVATQWVADAHRLLSSLGSAVLDDIDSSTSAVVVGASPHAAAEGTTSGSSKAHSAEEIEALLNTAIQEGIQSKHRTVLEETVQQSKEWLKRAADMRTNPAALLTTDELKAFIKAGERVIYKKQRDEEIQNLRQELKRAKQWKIKFDRSGFDVGTAIAEHLSELVDESKTILVNLSEYTDSIVQVNKTYCLCRQAYHGEMIGCDTCDEWYHFQCVGLSSNAAEKCAKYMCIRCALKNSYGQSANMVAQLTNKWMNCTEHFRRRDEAFQKVAKKLYKDEKELQKAQTVLKSLLESTPSAMGAGITSSSTTTSSAQPNESTTTDTTTTINPTTTTTADTTTNTATTTTTPSIAFSAADAEKILIAKRDYDQFEGAVNKAVQEKDKLGRAIALETQLHKEIFRWMQAMQELMWPCTEEQVALGRPVGPSVSAPINTTSVLEYNRALLAQLTSLLPVGMTHMERAATLVGIVNLEDVALVLDAFRWMSWTNICLHMLRNPPTTPALRQLIDVTKNMRCIDEKVIKILSGVLQRAGNWKSKAKKALALPQKKPDLARFQALSVEGATHPFTCRMKERLRAILSSHPSTTTGGVASTDTTSSSNAPDSSTSKPSKRGPKPNQLIAADQQTGAGATGAGAGWSVDTWTARIAASGVDECASSDEEELIVKIAHAQESGAEFLPLTVRSPYVQTYAPLNPQNLADMPDLTWPPQLLVPRRRATGAIANAAAATGTATVTSSLPSSSVAGGDNMSSSSAVTAASSTVGP